MIKSEVTRQLVPDNVDECCTNSAVQSSHQIAVFLLNLKSADHDFACFGLYHMALRTMKNTILHIIAAAHQYLSLRLTFFRSLSGPFDLAAIWSQLFRF